MNIYIVIPAHNEADCISLTLESIVKQTLLPKQLVIVNDNSTDNTKSIVEKFVSKHSWITLINSTSSNKHLPGSKIINAFYKGFKILDSNYDIICKFDADLIFPENYLEKISNHFKGNAKLGMAAGFCYISKNDNWVIENLTRKDHIRGALKAYRKKCFNDIGKLKPAMGWDTVDELLAQYYDWELLTDSSLHVKHLKPTGINYNKSAKYLQGEAMYKMRYGFLLNLLTALKMGVKKRKISYFNNYMVGYCKAVINKPDRLVTISQGVFIRKLRWKNILQKLKK
ncbi:glycosyltransferase [uncultured Lacinutrix sp.]|uniref:glycosyltransferase family 2 protein n=1 Tax=uncultured Lacinutrix sp. TaxID=574032 RepID=UPI0026026971|nr:glycosyltransferase [uncultured Lacinutrix sp.]